jgi:hypothetical protein
VAGKNAIDWDDRKAVAKLKKMASYLSSKELARANAAALNRSGKSAGGKHRKASAASVTAPAESVTKAFKDRKATPSQPQYMITISGRYTLPLRHFAGMRQTATGVAVKIWRNGKDSVLRGTFLVHQFSGNAFRRVGEQRGPIKTLYGPLPTSLAQGKSDVLYQAFEKMFRARIAQEIKFRFTKLSR